MKGAKVPKKLNPDQLAKQLAAGLSAMQLSLTDTQQKQLIDYLLLLNKWNAVYNLTAIRDPLQMVSRQLLDSLAILPWVRGPRVLDVGTGGGIPGIPLAIALPELDFTLNDANGKKTRFVQQAVGSLGLSNVAVVHQRVEQIEQEQGFDTIVSRAFADIHDMLDLTQSLRAPNGQWSAMKASVDELDTRPLPEGMQAEVHRLAIPGETGQRHLVRVYPQ